MSERATPLASLGFALAALALLASACTSQDRYGAIREEHRQQCELAVSEALRERCLEQLPPASYDDYERLRRKLPAASESRRRRMRDDAA